MSAGTSRTAGVHARLAHCRAWLQRVTARPSRPPQALERPPQAGRRQEAEAQAPRARQTAVPPAPEGLPAAAPSLRAHYRAVLDEAREGHGCFYELYVQNLSLLLDEWMERVPPSQRAAAQQLVHACPDYAPDRNGTWVYDPDLSDVRYVPARRPGSTDQPHPPAEGSRQEGADADPHARQHSGGVE